MKKNALATHTTLLYMHFCLQSFFNELLAMTRQAEKDRKSKDKAEDSALLSNVQ